MNSGPGHRDSAKTVMTRRDFAETNRFKLKLAQDSTSNIQNSHKSQPTDSMQINTQQTKSNNQTKGNNHRPRTDSTETKSKTPNPSTTAMTQGTELGSNSELDLVQNEVTRKIAARKTR